MNDEEKNVEEVKEEIVETPVDQKQPAEVETPKVEEVTPSPTNNNKSGGNKTVIIIMGIIIIALLAVIIFLLLSGNDKDKNTNTNTNNNDNSTKNTENLENIENTEINNNNTEKENVEVNTGDNNIEKDITVPEIINSLSSKFEKLFGDYIYVLGENDNKNLFGRVLEYRTNFVEIKNPPDDNDYAYFVGQLSLDYVKKEYYDLFGEELDTSVEYPGSCAKSYYDKDKNLFIQKKYGCDAGWGWNASGYRYKYTEDNNNAYIYVAVAVHSGIEKIDILTDNDTKKVYKTIEGNTDSFTIDASNYDSFAKYRVTFKKVGNDYYYKGVQKIEEGK